MIVQKEIAQSLFKKGFNEECNYYFYQLIDNFAYHKSQFNFNQPFILAPYNEQALNWIFNTDIIDEYIVLNANMNSREDWFKFWHTQLLENKFELMGEFVFKLREYFQTHKIHFTVTPVYVNENINLKFIFKIILEYNNFQEVESFNTLNISLFDSYKEAEKYCIDEIFTILKYKKYIPTQNSLEHKILDSFENGTGKLLVTKDLVEIGKGDHYLSEGLISDLNIFTWKEQNVRPYKAIKIIGKSKDFKWNVLTQGDINSIIVVEI